MKLMEDYKKEPGGKERLNERNPKWINDDYVKFLRYGQYFVEKNGEGIVAFINPHGFLDNPTFRGMRWHLLKTYDKIYTIDLHGNSKKKEVSPDGTPDKNVFDIMQGVSINFFVKTGKKKANELGQIFHCDCWGTRQWKYGFLNNNNLRSICFTPLQKKAPQYFMVPKNYEIEERFSQGFGLSELFGTSVMGFQTHRDHFAVADSKHELQRRINELLNESIETHSLADKYSLKDVGKWRLSEKRKEIFRSDIDLNITDCSYRPFDNKFVFLDKAINDRPRPELKQHVVNKDNLCLLVSKQQSVPRFRHSFLAKYPASDCTLSSKSREGNQIFPLFVYPDANQMSIEEIKEKSSARIPNLSTVLLTKIANKLGLKFTGEKVNSSNTFAPIDLLDYIYAVLYSPTYRETYKEFLKIDFPRISYPKDVETFWKLVELGSELRRIHLLESPTVEQYVSSYPQDGENTVTRKIVKKDYELDEGQETGRVWINDTQYFDKVPKLAWDFYIGGYQPAQKWLKDRHGRELSFDDILHYQKIIVALCETARLMQAIDEIDFLE